jgi:hypothetical protein
VFFTLFKGIFDISSFFGNKNHFEGIGIYRNVGKKLKGELSREMSLVKVIKK